MTAERNQEQDVLGRASRTAAMENDLEGFHGPNAGYLAELHERFLQNPGSVDSATRAFLEQLDRDLVGAESNGTAGSVSATAPAAASLAKAVGVGALAETIRRRGHLISDLDPLGGGSPGDPDLDPAAHGLSDDDLRALPAAIVRGRFGETAADALEAIRDLRAAYSGSTGYDFEHVHNPAERAWLRDAVEWERFCKPDDPTQDEALLQRLTDVEALERFLHRVFPGQKRFSIEGLDMLVPMLDEIISRSAKVSSKDVFIAMAHRGRLNVMAHVLGKPYEQILSRFHDTSHRDGVAPSDAPDSGWSGDVKYHLGARSAYRRSDVVQMQLTLPPNPSHLEFVNPVAAGMARASVDNRYQPGEPQLDPNGGLAILIHGDAAFPGQGVVAETLNLSRLAGYQTGGTIHIIANNQVGFTTNPSDSRSTLYASDLAKGFEIPVVHVNADDVAACVAAARLAQAYRVKFRKDFLIDLIGYRRWGHNEGDEPGFTHPLMYQAISEHATVREIWAESLVNRDSVTRERADEMYSDAMSLLQNIRDKVSDEPAPEPASFVRFSGAIADAVDRIETAVSEETLRDINHGLLKIPDEFVLNPKLARFQQRRAEALEQGDGIDWGHAEALAFGSLILDGTPIRLTGQDTRRGTFSHRHLSYTDPRTGTVYTPLQAISGAEASFALYDSPLSENATLGFEYGYSVQAGDTLVLWEAQFGDFANGAQVIIDQFIVSARSKWGISPSLVLLLPHGYEGQGPEHSSARLPRFLHLCAEANLRVVNATTAAQYFHVLRRQAALLTIDPRPLILFTPKSLLRHPRASSRLEHLSSGHFESVIDDRGAVHRKETITRIVLCSGKIYVDLLDSGLYEKAKNVAVVRVEELYPFPQKRLAEVIDSYGALQEVVWVQEEPRNLGAWDSVEPRIREILRERVSLSCISRNASASPAAGESDWHSSEQRRIITEALKATKAAGRPRKAARNREAVRRVG